MTREASGPPRSVALGLGSNLGDRVTNLAKGVEGLARVLEGMGCSPVYESEPVGSEYAGQRAFLNMCCVGRVRVGPSALLRRLHDIEAEAGRRRSGGGAGPRRLDVDLLLYGDQVIDEPGLQVPHPRMPERAFVLMPLADVAQDWRHPVLERSVEALAGDVEPSGVRRYRGPLPEPIRSRTDREP